MLFILSLLKKFDHNFTALKIEISDARISYYFIKRLCVKLEIRLDWKKFQILYIYKYKYKYRENFEGYYNSNYYRSGTFFCTRKCH